MDAEFLKRPVVTDFTALKHLKVQAGARDKQALTQAAKQFESLFINSLMKSMRKANDFLSENNPLKSKQTVFFQEMLDQQQSLELSNEGGIGLSDMLVQQLQKFTVSQKNERSGNDVKVAATEDIKKQILTSAPVKELMSHLSKSGAFVFTPQTFVKAIWRHAKEYAEQLNLDPKLLVAQAALETGWGKHINKDEQGQISHNLFNIKAGNDWHAKTTQTVTTEFNNGQAQTVTDTFRSYDSFSESFQDYINLIQKSSRYQNAISVSDDPRQYIQALHKAGYATDPQYPDKVLAIFDSETLAGAIQAVEKQP